MALIQKSSIEQVVAAADMVEIVSARTPLRRVGARWTGRCPFHEERTPSFSVNATDKLFYCFGCGKGGDLITFIREAEGLDFAEAVEALADRYGIELEYEESSPQHEERRRRQERLRDLLEHAAKFYERYLWDASEAEAARAYLVERGLAEDICREFRLGLAPLRPRVAAKALEKGFTREELQATGLIGRRGTDYFSGRLLFPLTDWRGHVVGFQARKLREDDPLHGKYVNSPEGELFRKGTLLYGLHLARNAIAKEDKAVIVEGNTDVLALRQAGVLPVVASMGTALTASQLEELGRVRTLTSRLYLCFDGDAAGEAAALRGMELAVKKGFDVRVVPLPPGEDPADSPEGFTGRLEGAEGYLAYRVRIELDRTPDRQEAFVRVREILAGFTDSPELQDAIQLAADRLDLPPETQSGLAPRTRATTGTISPKLLDAGDRLERDALAGVLAHPDLREALAELSLDHFDSELHRRVRAHIVDDEPAGTDVAALLAELDALADAEGIDEETARELLLRVRARQIRRELAQADPERMKDLQDALTKIRAAVGEPV
ncbi:MAG: DNA primase [Actinobacteria bacterium]|nr:MAG: DNA primase [Actinomycetota bacterium]